MPITLPVSYTTVGIMQTTLAEVGSVSTVTSGLLAHFAGRAEAEINAKLSMRYALPFSGEIPMLTALATDLGLYYLLTRKPLVGSQSKSDPWLQKYKEARDLLDSIAQGKMRLVDASGQLVGYSLDTTTVKVWSTAENYQPTFDERDPETWEPDEDKLDDLEDSKT